MRIERFEGDFRFLSNFWPSKILPPTLEHHFQAAKVRLTHQRAEEWRQRIMSATSPGLAKRHGRLAPCWVDWDAVKDSVMLVLVQKKFTDPDLRDLLLATHPLEIHEGNTWHDNYWGECTCLQCRSHKKFNKLGEILMKVRQEIEANDPH